jgi:lipopolysaccharide export system protein LptC
MKQWGSALFPLGVLFALAALTYWLRYATELPEPSQDGKHRHDPDYIVTTATLRKLDLDGNLKYTLKAVDIRHYPDDDSTDMTLPNVVYLNPSKPPVTITAQRGHASKDGEQVDLYDEVHIHRAPSAKDEAMDATMEQLTVLPDDEKAYTKSPVLITQGISWVKGIGMQVDNRAQTYILESQAYAVLESRYAKKKTP